jgi:hypothetical protein
MIEASFTKHAREMEDAAIGLSPNERRQLISLLKKLGKAAEASALTRAS